MLSYAFKCNEANVMFMWKDTPLDSNLEECVCAVPDNGCVFIIRAANSAEPAGCL